MMQPKLISNSSAVKTDFDWQNPDYGPVFRERIARLDRLRREPQLLPALKVYYRTHLAQFIGDFGVTVDPRNIERGLPAIIPFVLFPTQVDWVSWLLERWQSQTPGITEKSRDMGLSWLSVAAACSLCLFFPGMAVGFGSKKEELVDRLGDPKSLFYKARLFLQYLPHEFRGGFEASIHAPHMRIVFPESGSVITGEAGDSIGRGDRKSIYFIDEAAHLERPALIDASLSATTNCRIDISSVNGMANSFALRRHSGKISVFTAHWMSDPRKSPAWYEKQCAQLDPVTVAQEIDLNYSASVEGVLIPAPWIQAAIGALQKLGVAPSGRRYAGLDVADEGIDRNAFAGRHGVLLTHLESWSGKGGDIYQSVVKAFAICDHYGFDSFDYDADGLGAGVRGDARQINQERQNAGLKSVNDQPFRGSGGVYDPEGQMVPERLNKDFFANAKAQAWWSLRIRFQNTYRAVIEGLPVQIDDLIAIEPNCPELQNLVMELSQPTYSINGVGKVLIDKMPDGARSPNLADAVMICYQPASRALDAWLRQ